MTTRRPLFVVFEGADISGKTTQVELMKKRLESEGLSVATTSFPRYDNPVGNAISRHLRGELLVCVGPDGDRANEDDLYLQALHTFDRYDEAPHIQRALTEGISVVSSRWWQSSVIYGTDSGLDFDLLDRVHSLLPRADLNILLHLSEEESLRRRPDLRDRFEKDRLKQQRLRRAYQDLWTLHSEHDPFAWVVIASDELMADQVHAEVWEHVKFIV